MRIFLRVFEQVQKDNTQISKYNVETVLATPKVDRPLNDAIDLIFLQDRNQRFHKAFFNEILNNVHVNQITDEDQARD